MKAEEFAGLIDKVKYVNQENPFSKMLSGLSEAISSEEDSLDIDKCLDIIEKSSGFEDPQLIFGFIYANMSNRRNNVLIKKSFAAADYI